MTKNLEHSIQCFLAIQDSSVENSLFISVLHFLIGLFDSLEVDFLRSLYILDFSTMSVVGLPYKKLFGFMRFHLSVVDLRT